MKRFLSTFVIAAWLLDGQDVATISVDVRLVRVALSRVNETLLRHSTGESSHAIHVFQCHLYHSGGGDGKVECATR